MNWEAVGAIGQILGVIVVVLSLIYVAAQVRQGNRFAKLQARQRMIEQAHDELYGQMADPAITYASVKPASLTEEEQARLSLFLIAFMRQREWEWFEYGDGIIDKDVYTGLSRRDPDSSRHAACSQVVESAGAVRVQPAVRRRGR
jgi:hypothetical protein